MRRSGLLALMALMLIIVGATRSEAQSPSPELQRQAHSGMAAAGADDAAVAAFAAQLDLEAFGQLAVHNEGRVKSLDTHARGMMQYVSGSRMIEGRSPTFTYLDFMLRPEAYVEADVIFIKQKQMRADIARLLSKASDDQTGAADDPELAVRLERFMKTGLISPTTLVRGDVQELLGRLSADVLRGAKFVEMIHTAMSVMNPDGLRASLKLVAPPGGGINDPWLTIEDLSRRPFDADTLNPELQSQIANAWIGFTKGWSELNAPAVNDAAATLVSALPKVNGAIYPEQGRLAWESWYFKMRNLTWVWVFYALSLVPLLLALVYRWPAARWIGMLMFLGAFGMHTFAVMLRWYVADRWPNSNMFEAVTTAAWFGGCLALLLEAAVRRLPMRNLFALGSATASMCALMAVHFLPLQLNPNISNMMPVLNDVWLYIHTNVIILSYCLIFIAAVTAVLYLAYRAAGALAGWQRTAEYARVGGAGSLILTRPDGTSYMDDQRSTFGQILDGTTMVLMEMSFILLWAGLVMGAIWADHSWGRPWGWDPKEVFALNTFIVFLVLVHVRLKVKDKGLWTAILAVIGAAVMLFNWIIINFAISGLHSYA